MEVKYRNTLADLIRFNVYVQVRQRVLQILCALLSLGLVYTLWPTIGQSDTGLAIKIVILLALLVIILSIFGVIAFLFTILSVFLSRSRHILGEHTVALNENGIVETTSLGRHETTWQGVHRIVETGTLVMLFITPLSAHLIPRHAFDNPSDLDRFVSYVKERMRDANA